MDTFILSSTLQTTLKRHAVYPGADLLEKAAKAAEALTREAQKAAEVESKFKALKDISPFPENYQGLSDLPGG